MFANRILDVSVLLVCRNGVMYIPAARLCEYLFICEKRNQCLFYLITFTKKAHRQAAYVGINSWFSSILCVK